MVNWILVELENDILFSIIGFFKKVFFLFFPNKNQLGFHMRYHLFLHYGWFLPNLEKDFIRTNMHTTVQPWHGTNIYNLNLDFQWLSLFLNYFDIWNRKKFNPRTMIIHSEARSKSCAFVYLMWISEKNSSHIEVLLFQQKIANPYRDKAHKSH